MTCSGWGLASHFVVHRAVHGAGATEFRSAWFVMSTGTELVALLVLRTRRPFWRSRPGRALLISSALIAVLTIALPYSPIAPVLGLDAVPPVILASRLALVVAYVAANELVKRWRPEPD